MAHNLSFRRYTRIFYMVMMLLMGGAGEVWADVDPANIIIEKLPNDAAGSVAVSVSGQTVTLTVSPATDYYVNKNTIRAEKMVSLPNAARRRAPILANTLPVSGNDEAAYGDPKSYTFVVPEGSVGAYVTVTFFKKTSGLTPVTDLSQIGTTGDYEIVSDINASGHTSLASFTGTLTARAKADGTFPVISGLTVPLFTTATDATISNIMLQDVSISQTGYVGAICGTADGTTRIYNCGILPTSPDASSTSTIGSSGDKGSEPSYCGSLVGFLDGTARVVNCFSYANVSGVTTAAGIVGYNNVATTANSSSTTTYLKTMVMNCMFYGNITGASTMKPVYGGQKISNASATGVNNYNYYRDGEDVTFDDNYANFDAYFCSLPADEEYLTRFEYYRSILNSNRQLCTYWVTDKKVTDTDPTKAQTAADTALIAKWVLDPSIAPYPILKKWGKYPSVINPDPQNVWNPITKQNIARTSAEAYQGKKLGTLKVTINAGTKHAGSVTSPISEKEYVIMDMDTLNHDYCYAKIQLPYYNELFGDPTVQIPDQIPDPSDEDAYNNYINKWNNRYGGNYKDYVVTGWKITGVSGGKTGSFKGYAFASSGGVSAGAISPDEESTTAWEDGFNFADRNCTNKDKYAKSGRVFAQGGYYYVPEGVTSITIEAYWGKAVYLHNKDHSLDRVNVAQGADGVATAEYGASFSPAGTLSDTFQGQTVQTTLQEAISALTLVGTSYTVYDQAIVLVGNVQVKNRSESVGRDKTASNSRPFTIMSVDADMDNEPDYCLELQFRQKVDRPGIHPVRFDFLPVPELGLAIKTNQNAYAIGVFIPQGHFEITETSFMHTTQFEYDGDVGRVESPIILNGGHFEQIVVRYGNKDKVSFFLLGGHFRMKRFTPGHHASNNSNATVRHCVVNAIGGDYPEFYLSGVYKPDLPVRADNPHCYINGGRFGTVAGAAYEQVNGNVTFKIDHAIIDKFYGGGMNGAKPVTGDIDVTINNSIVYDIFCGGPMVGPMTKPNGGTRKTVTTTADNTIFNNFFGGGNGGTSYYREQKYDNDVAWPTPDSKWTEDNTYYFTSFDPLNFSNSKKYDTNKGYHDQFVFEIFNSSNGLNANAVIRTIFVWAQFGTTITGTVTNTLTNCTVEHDFYGGGNLGTVDGNVISTLTNTHVKGSVFGGGYSAEIPRFRVHDTSSVHVPQRNKAGLIEEQGYLDYVQDDDGNDRYYRWTNDKNNNTASTNAPTYWSDADKEYKCYTPISLTGLGEVDGTTTLTIDGTSQIDGNVYGGGDASAVMKKAGVADSGNATVILQGKAEVYGNVFGGGNHGTVAGNTEVIIK